MKGCILVEVLEYYVPVLVEILEYYLYWWKYRPLSVPFLILISGISQPSRLDESVLVGVLEYYLYWWKCLSTICTICCDISCCPLSDNRTSATLLVSFCLRQHYLVTVLLSIYTIYGLQWILQRTCIECIITVRWGVLEHQKCVNCLFGVWCGWWLVVVWLNIRCVSGNVWYYWWLNWLINS